jgi:hypothetical protein
MWLGCWLLVAGCWLLVAGCWLLVAGCWLLVVGCWLLVAGCWLLVAGCWLLVAGCWLLVAGCWLLTGGLRSSSMLLGFAQCLWCLMMTNLLHPLFTRSRLWSWYFIARLSAATTSAVGGLVLFECNILRWAG